MKRPGYMPMEARVIAHTDLDGVASAAIYTSLVRRSLGRKAPVTVHFVEPHGLLNLLSKSIPPGFEGVLAVMDVGMNEAYMRGVSRLVGKLVKEGARVEWYDHHVWERGWVEELRAAGARVVVDTSTCAAGVVFEHAFPGVEREECHGMLVSAVCSSDLWRWDDPLSPLLYRATRSPRGPRGDGFRRRLVEEMSECRILSDELIERAERSLEEELKGYGRLEREVIVRRVCGDLAGVVYRDFDHPGVSLAAHYMLGRLGLDLAVIVKPDGSVSFRSTKGVARVYALCFEGGGHMNASGGRVRVPAVLKPFVSFLPPLRRWYLVHKVLRTLASCCNGPSRC